MLQTRNIHIDDKKRITILFLNICSSTRSLSSKRITNNYDKSEKDQNDRDEACSWYRANSFPTISEK